MAPSTTPSRTMLVYRRELISREQAACGDRGREFFGRRRLQRRERLGYALQALRPSRDSTVREPGVAHDWRNEGVRHRRRLLPAGAIGYCLSRVPPARSRMTCGDTKL